MKKIVSIITVMILFLSSITCIHAMNSYYIEELEVEWTLKENGLLYVYETYEVYFYEGFQKEMVYKLPIERKYSFEQNNISVSSAIIDVKVLSNHSHQKTKTIDGYTIEFNDFDNSKEVIEISYIVKLDTIERNNCEAVVFDMVKGRLDGKMKKVNFTLHLPESITDDQIEIFAKFKDNMEYHINEQIIKGSVENVGIASGVEVLLYSDGYLHTLDYDLVNYIAIGVCYILAFIVVIILRNKGKENEIEEIVDISIINELNALEVGYLHKGYSDQRDVVALFLEWAQKGYIKIEYITNPKTIIFHKKRELPVTAKMYEKELFNEMFQTNTSVRLKMLRTVFGNCIKKAQKQMVSSFKDKDKKVYLSDLEKLILCTLCSFPLVVVIGLQVFVRTLSFTQVLVVIVLYDSIVELYCLLMLKVSQKKKKYGLLLTTMVFMSICIFLISNHYYGQYVPMGILLITVILSMILVFTVCYIKMRGDYGNETLSKVKGLYAYISKGNNELYHKAKGVEELLPYAYVFKLENGLLSKLEVIEWFAFGEFIDASTFMYDHIFSITIERRYSI